MEVNELNKNAMGGTELLGMRLRNSIGDNILSNFQIHFSRVREMDHEKYQIFYAHDLAEDPEAFKALGNGNYQRFDGIVFVSHWQQTMYNRILGVPYNNGIVIQNSIERFPTHAKPKDKIRLIYSSTPHRGLDILHAAFNDLSKDRDDLELNVFSSFDLYGWPERDQQFSTLFKALDSHENINYSRSIPNEKIREELKRSHIFAYPSTWTETSCLCLIEAMCAGCVSVHSSLGALPETSMGMTDMYGFCEDKNAHYLKFRNKLKLAIDFIEGGGKPSSFITQSANDKYSLENFKVKWHIFLKNILENTDGPKIKEGHTQ